MRKEYPKYILKEIERLQWILDLSRYTLDNYKGDDRDYINKVYNQIQDLEMRIYKLVHYDNQEAWKR